MQWLRAEQDNLVVIVERSLGSGVRLEDAARALLSLHPVVLHYGSLASQLSRWDGVLAASSALPPELRARTLIARGRLRGRAGQGAAARADLEAGVELASEIGAGALLGQASTELARVLHSLGDRGGAHAALARALTILDASGDRLLQGLAHRALGSLESEESLSERAVLSFERAVAALRAARATGLVASTLVNLGIARLDCGDLPPARRDLEASLAACGRGEAPPGVEGAARGGLARLAHLEGDLAEAATQYELAIERAKRVDDRRFEGLYTGFLGLVRAEMGNREGAIELLRASASTLSDSGDLAYAALFDAHAAVFAACCEREASQAQAALERALADVSPRGDGAAVVLARRLAGRAVGPGASPPAAELAISTTGRWFRPVGGDSVDCASHRTLRRLLVCLARDAVERPGRVLSANELMLAVWPDERPSSASRNRLKTLMSKLRKLGLRDALISDPDGYRLDHVAPIVLVDDDAAG
jgi:tetratricopeptide (TPR) repeat protein